MVTNKEIKKGFVTSINGFVPLIYEDEYWDNIIDWCEKEFSYKTLWDNFTSMINTKFSGDMASYNTELKLVQDDFYGIGKIINSGPLSAFVSTIRVNEDINNVRTRSQEKTILPNNGYYASIDLKEGFSQMFDKFNAISGRSFSEIVSEITEYPEIFLFKGNRLKIYSSMGDEAKKLLERCELIALTSIYESENEIIKGIKNAGGVLYKVLGDELIFYLGEKNPLSSKFIEKYGAKDFNIEGYDVHVNFYTSDKFWYKEKNDFHRIFVHKNIVTGIHKYLKRNFLRMFELVKLYNNEPITEMDTAIKEGYSYYIPKNRLEKADEPQNKEEGA